MASASAEPLQASAIGAPLTLRGHRLRNRIVFAAHAANLGEEAAPGAPPLWHLPQERARAYYAARAKGGAAIVVVEPLPVQAEAVWRRASLPSADARLLPHLSALAAAIRQEGALALLQLEHPGANGDFDNAHLPLASPSGGPSHASFHGSRPMSEADIEATLAAFAAAAALAREAGFDGVELGAGARSLFEQFWSPVLNERDDGWAADDARMPRFALRAIERVRGAIGQQGLLGFAMCGQPAPQIGLDAARREALAVALDETGALDYLALGAGSPYAAAAAFPSFLHGDAPARPLARALAGRLRRTAVLLSGGIRNASQAAEILAAGDASLIGLVRPLIADPELPAKAMAGDLAAIRPCIACNQGCVERPARDYATACVVNPVAGQESTGSAHDGELAATRRRVLVVGAGPAGLEAARAAARRGHRVTLVEAAESIGGQLRLIARQPGREAIGALIDWYALELMRLQVTVRLGTTATPALLGAEGAEIVVLATGARPAAVARQRSAPAMDALPGYGGGDCAMVEDVLDGSFQPRGSVLLLDDCNDWKGVGTALLLAERGLAVTLCTAAAVPGKAIAAQGVLGLVRARFKKLGVRELIQAQVIEWQPGRATIRRLLTGELSEEAFDCLVVANTPDRDGRLQAALEAEGPHDLPWQAIGDGLAPRNVAAAILEGHRLALSL